MHVCLSCELKANPCTFTMKSQLLILVQHCQAYMCELAVIYLRVLHQCNRDVFIDVCTAYITIFILINKLVLLLATTVVQIGCEKFKITVLE